MTRVGSLSEDQLRSVLSSAALAPRSSHAWLLCCTPSAVEIHAVPDPDGRELHLACGAALLNLRIAIGALGVEPTVELFPEPHRPELVARVRPHGRRGPSPTETALAAAIPRPHTQRGPFSSLAVAPLMIERLRRAARAEQSWPAVITPTQLPILRSLVPGLVREVGTAAEPHPLIVAVGSFHDHPAARVRAGQAMQRMLLTASSAGLSASLLAPVIEVPTIRARLRELVGGSLWPQVVLRIGHGAPAIPRPARNPLTVLETGV